MADVASRYARSNIAQSLESQFEHVKVSSDEATMTESNFTWDRNITASCIDVDEGLFDHRRELQYRNILSFELSTLFASS